MASGYPDHFVWGASAETYQGEGATGAIKIAPSHAPIWPASPIEADAEVADQVVGSRR